MIQANYFKLYFCHQYLMYLVAPLGVKPALGTGSHVAVFHVDGPQIHVALLIRNKVPHIADAAHLPWPLTQATRHWALWRQPSQEVGTNWNKWMSRSYKWPTAATHRGPLGADLPLAADLQLAGTGCFRPLQVSAVTRVDVEGAVGVNLPTQNLPVLHTQPAGLAALRPLTNIPAVWKKTTKCDMALLLELGLLLFWKKEVRKTWKAFIVFWCWKLYFLFLICFSENLSSTQGNSYKKI